MIDNYPPFGSASYETKPMPARSHGPCVLALANLAFSLCCPVLGFSLSLEMVADAGVSLDTDDGAPGFGVVFVLSLIDGCHLKPLLLVDRVRAAGWYW